MPSAKLLDSLSKEELFSIHEFLILEYASPPEIARDAEKEKVIESLERVLSHEDIRYCIDFFDNYDYYPVPWLKAELVNGLSEDLLFTLYSKFFDDLNLPEEREDLVKKLSESHFLQKEEARKYYLWQQYFRSRTTLEESEENPAYLQHSSSSLEIELQSLRNDIEEEGVENKGSEFGVKTNQASHVQELSSENGSKQTLQMASFFEGDDEGGYQTQRMSFETFVDFLQKKETNKPEFDTLAPEDFAPGPQPLRQEPELEGKDTLPPSGFGHSFSPSENLQSLSGLSNLSEHKGLPSIDFADEETKVAGPEFFEGLKKKKETNNPLEVHETKENLEPYLTENVEQQPAPRKKRMRQMTVALDAASFLELEMDAQVLEEDKEEGGDELVEESSETIDRTPYFGEADLNNTMALDSLESIEELPAHTEVEEAKGEEPLQLNASQEELSQVSFGDEPKTSGIGNAASQGGFAILTPKQVDSLTELLYRLSLLGGVYGRAQIHTIRVFFQKVLNFAPIQLRRVRNLLKKLEGEDTPHVPLSLEGFEDIAELLPYGNRICLMQTVLYLVGSKTAQNIERFREYIYEIAIEFKLHPADISIFNLFGIGLEEVQLTAFDCLEMLGVDIEATEQEIRKAHRDKIRQFHPDKFHSMGPEFQRLADRKTKELNIALEILLHKG